MYQLCVDEGNRRRERDNSWRFKRLALRQSEWRFALRSDEGLTLVTSAIVSFTASITLINTQLIHSLSSAALYWKQIWLGNKFSVVDPWNSLWEVGRILHHRTYAPSIMSQSEAVARQSGIRQELLVRAALVVRVLTAVVVQLVQESVVAHLQSAQTKRHDCLGCPGRFYQPICIWRHFRSSALVAMAT